MESENKVENEKYKLQLQYGDIIELDAENNNQLHKKIFFIKFINSSKIELLNDEKIITLNITDQGKLEEESINNIILLHRNESPSFVKQNNIERNKNISIYFKPSPLPKVINGIITNIEEDMIEITLIPNKEVIYIDFAYSGIPEDLNIDKIVITDVKDEIEEEMEEIFDKDITTEFLDLDNKDDNDYELINHKNDEELDEILLDEFELEEEEVELYHTVNVPENEKRYTLQAQMNDYIDNTLSKYKPEERSELIINNTNMELNRYKELREMYSDFDRNNNAKIPEEKGEFYKPLKEILFNLNKKLYWLLPVTSNSKNIITNDIDEMLEDEKINKLEMNEFIRRLNDTINKWSKNSSKEKLNDYNKYINDLLSLYDNTINNYKSKQAVYDIENNILEANTQINVINDIYDDFYSYVIKNNKLDKSQFVNEVYTEGLKMLEMNYINNKKIHKLKELTPNDKIVIISFITLPLPIINFSKINLDYTSISDRSNLNNNFVNYDKIMRESPYIAKYTVDKNTQNTFINTDKTIHNNNMFNNISNFSIDNTLEINSKEKYNLLLESFIPTNSNIISELSKQKNYMSYDSLINDTQSFNIDMYNMHDKDINLIKKLFNENINEYKKEYKESSEILRDLIVLLNKDKEDDERNYILNFDILNNELKKDLLENYDITEELFNTKSELVNYLIKIDNGKFFMNSLNKNIIDLVVVNILDNYIKKSQEKQVATDLQKDDNCEKYYLSKKYISLEDLESDNDKKIFFDSIYDNTVYSLANEYKNEMDTMARPQFFDFLTGKLKDIMNLTEKNAIREATAIIEEKREIVDGDYALLLDKETKKNYIYIRRDDKWVLDEKFKFDFYIDSNKIICDINKDCISVNDKCISTDKFEKQNLKADVDKILENFQAKYNLNVEEIKGKVNLSYENAKQYLKKIKNINKHKEEYINDIILENYLETDTNIVVSPYEKLRDKILSITDFAKKHEFVKKFCLKFTRNAINNENENWLYCNKTSAMLIPKFLLKLANAFTNKQDYTRELDTICAEQGTISDDNNFWVDKHSGYIIKRIDFSTDEGYDEKGFKLNTNELLEDEFTLNTKELLQDEFTLNIDKIKKSENPDIQTINNIIKSMSQMIGININSYNEFIINNVLNLQKKYVQEYDKLLLKLKKQNKKAPSYENTYNQSLLFLTLTYMIVAIQISIPSVKSKKTFPGCIKSFNGYPIDGEQDKSSIIYIACIANKMKSSIKPWNTITNESSTIKKIESIIDKYVIKDQKIEELMNKKREHLLTNKDEIIPDNLSINNWHNFMPPLIDINISREDTQPLDTTFNDELRSNYTKARKNNIKETITSKTIYLSNSIINSIQSTVKKNGVLLENSAGEPFLENACCNSTINTVKYFMKEDKSLADNNNLIEHYNNILESINILSTPSILYNPNNTKIILPDLEYDFNEEVIYKAFIYYCNFNNDLDIDDDLKGICLDKPTDFKNNNNTIVENIELLKGQGKVYTKKSLEQLLEAVNKKNILNYNINNPIPNNKELLMDIVKNYKESSLENKIDENLFEKLENLLDTFDIENNDNPELDDIKNYLSSANIAMIDNITYFFENMPHLSKKISNELQKFLKMEIDVTNTKFYLNYLHNFLNVFPNIILNKNINYNSVPKHWELSEKHNNDIKNIIEKYYNKLMGFSNINGLKLVFDLIRNKCSILIQLMSLSKYNSPITVSNSDEDLTINSIFDQEFIKYLYTYIFNSVIYEFINITNNDYFNLEIATYDDYNEQRLQQSITNYIYEFFNIMNTHHNLLNLNYNKIKNKISIAKEKEKNDITEYLKNLTDDERAVQNVLKQHKLEGWGAGLKKGLTQYVAENYDEERNKMEKQLEVDRKLKKNSAVNDMNAEIFRFDMEEDERKAQEIEDAENDMSNVPDDDDENSDYE